MAQSTFEAWQEKVVEGLFLIAADKSAQQAQAAEMAKRLGAFTQQDFPHIGGEPAPAGTEAFLD
jgi:hypothetical protein